METDFPVSRLKSTKVKKRNYFFWLKLFLFVGNGNLMRKRLRLQDVELDRLEVELGQRVDEHVAWEDDVKLAEPQQLWTVLAHRGLNYFAFFPLQDRPAGGIKIQLNSGRLWRWMKLTSWWTTEDWRGRRRATSIFGSSWRFLRLRCGTLMAAGQRDRATRLRSKLLGGSCAGWRRPCRTSPAGQCRASPRDSGWVAIAPRPSTRRSGRPAAECSWSWWCLAVWCGRRGTSPTAHPYAHVPASRSRLQADHQV